MESVYITFTSDINVAKINRFESYYILLKFIDLMYATVFKKDFILFGS